MSKNILSVFRSDNTRLLCLRLNFYVYLRCGVWEDGQVKHP